MRIEEQCFIVYDNETGELVRWGTAFGNDALYAADLRTETAVVVPRETQIVTQVRDDAFRAVLEAQIDSQATALTMPGRKPAHARKLAEAKAGGGPMLQAEADATGMEIADLCALVIERAAAQEALEVRIEAARRATKAAVRAAPNIGKAHQASQIDWQAIAQG